MSKIEWTNETWNVTTGCTRVSAGCDNCYAVAMTKRLANIQATEEKYGGLVNEGKNHFNGTIKLHEDELEKPLRWRKPRKVFVNSMSDLFHPEVPFDFVDKVFAVMAIAEDHTFQILTKRPERMSEYFNNRYSQSKVMTQIDVIGEDEKLFDRAIDGAVNLGFNDFPLPNVWLGTSVENQEAADERIQHLLKCPAAIRFLSCEPLLGPVDLTDISVGNQLYDCLKGKADLDPFMNASIHWVIAGGESGPNARPMNPEWVRYLRDQCEEAAVPFFFKQWGAYRPAKPGEHIPDTVFKHGPSLDGKVWWFGKKKAGNLLDGQPHQQFPTPHPEPTSNF